MSALRPFKLISFVSILSFVIACQSNKKYQDNTSLETPPILKSITPIDTSLVAKKEPESGLNNAVILVDATHLSLKQPFEQAWTTLAMALEFNHIEISDRNRETGDYFINYDPDNISDKDSDLVDNIASFLFNNDYEEAAYKLTLTKNTQGVSISAKKLTPISMDLLDDGEDIKFDDKFNQGVEKLIRHLYGTLKNDLPLN